MFHPTEEEQGELCYRGRNIMMGYMAQPDLGEEHMEELKKKNAEAIDADGWLHSGDKGCLSASGAYCTG
jgi:long-subunit acyl-CoA synthetase (AMP-forming)